MFRSVQKVRCFGSAPCAPSLSAPSAMSRFPHHVLCFLFRTKCDVRLPYHVRCLCSAPRAMSRFSAPSAMFAFRTMCAVFRFRTMCDVLISAPSALVCSALSAMTCSAPSAMVCPAPSAMFGSVPGAMFFGSAPSAMIYSAPSAMICSAPSAMICSAPSAMFGSAPSATFVFPHLVQHLFSAFECDVFCFAPSALFFGFHFEIVSKQRAFSYNDVPKVSSRFWNGGLCSNTPTCGA